MLLRPSYRLTILLFLLYIALPACKKAGVTDNATAAQKHTYPVGASLGEGYTEFIGPEGGVINSPDNSLRIEIPPGALASGQEIGIEPVEGTCPAGSGLSYRLTPHGLTFNKPVTLTFSYDGLEETLAPEALAVVSQDEPGAWKTAGPLVHHESDRTVSVAVTHFSDWSLVETLRLLPDVASVKPGGQVKLSAVRFTQNPDDDFLVPLTGTVISRHQPLEGRYVQRWYVSGPGSLNAQGSEATFTAADSEGESFVTAELNVEGKKVLLIAQITIMAEGIRLRIDGGAWQHFQGIATRLPEGYYTIANYVFDADQPQLKLLWRGGPAIVYPWCDNAVFQHVVHALSYTYVSTYEQNQNIFFSRGRLRVRQSEGDGKKYLLGTAYIHPSGLIINATGKQESTSEVEVAFRVQQGW